MDRAERQESLLHVWAQLETLHDLTYFAKECRDSYKALGVSDSWARYFGGRAAPLGRVGPGIVAATFYSFSFASISSALPDVWEIASPEQFVTARFEGFLATYQRILDQSPLAPTDEVLGRAADLAYRIAINGDRAGHPLYAANLDVDPPNDPISRLFHAATLIREYRGDCHNDLLATHEIDGPRAHHLMVALGAEDEATTRTSRGYTPEEWSEANEDLIRRGILDLQGRLTPSGRQFRADIEDRTNQLMGSLFFSTSDAELSELQALVGPLEIAIKHSGSLPHFSRVFELLEAEGAPIYRQPNPADSNT